MLRACSFGGALSGQNRPLSGCLLTCPPERFDDYSNWHVKTRPMRQRSVPGPEHAQCEDMAAGPSDVCFTQKRTSTVALASGLLRRATHVFRYRSARQAGVMSGLRKIVSPQFMQRYCFSRPGPLKTNFSPGCPGSSGPFVSCALQASHNLIIVASRH
jgi:hypothetical protein